MIQINLCAC